MLQAEINIDDLFGQIILLGLLHLALGNSSSGFKDFGFSDPLGFELRLALLILFHILQQETCEGIISRGAQHLVSFGNIWPGKIKGIQQLKRFQAIRKCSKRLKEV